jgi:TPR repeat protein
MTYEEFKKRYTYNPSTDLLGEGAFGKVFRAVDTLTDLRVAIKIASVNFNNEKYSLLEEFNKLKHVSPHINIVLYDECHRFTTDMGTFDIAISDYYPLGSLNKVLKNQSLTDADKYDIAKGVLDGLQHLHQLGMVHRDLKPGNVLIQRQRGQFIAKICDFGLSKHSDVNNQSSLSQSFMGGTVNYSSPEQLKGNPTRRNTDLWSFGIILYELLTGEIAYRLDDTSESTRVQMFQKMQHQELTSSFSQIKEPFATIIRGCLQVDPSQRYTSVEQIKQSMATNLASNLTEKSPTIEADKISSKQPLQAENKKDNDATSLLPKEDKTILVNLRQNEPSIQKKLVKRKPKRSLLPYLAAGGIGGLLIVGVIWWQMMRHDTTIGVDQANMAKADSCFKVGNTFYNGANGVVQDFKEAAKWYQQAASLGNSDSQNILGSMFHYGQGVNKDESQAVKWFQESAEHGNAKGQKNLGYMYYYGLGVSKDYEGAMTWFRKSAEQGNVEGCTNLGIMYEQGVGVDTNNVEAMKWYRKAADQNYPLAQYYVGTMYITGKSGEPEHQSHRKALQWYHLAAQLGDKNARRELIKIAKQ